MTTAPPRLAAELERRILACPTLPTLPAVALELLRLCSAEEIDLWRISAALGSDPALAARVLRTANSVSVAARGRVSTLTRAVSLLGSNAVVAVALSFSLVRGRRRDEAGALDRSAFWRRAVFAALAARTLAEGAFPEVDPEEAFLGALLQDLGVLALAEVFPRRYGALCARAAGDHGALAALEREAWGADHAAVSALLARTWRLPPHLELAVGESHGDRAPADAAPVERGLVDCVALSGPLADPWVAPVPEGTLEPLLETARTRLGLEAAALDAVLARMALAVPEASAEFDIDLGRGARLAEVLAEARRLPAALGLRAPGREAPAPAEAGAALDQALRFALEYARARREPLALLLVARVPAAPAGPGALQAFLRDCVRSTDLVGEERAGALLLLPDTRLGDARRAAERILRLAARAASGGQAISIGISAVEDPAAVSVARLRAAARVALDAACARGPGQLTVMPLVGGGAAA